MSKWQKVRVGDLLKRSKITIDIEECNIYKRVTIRGKHKGISLRDEEIGKKIGLNIPKQPSLLNMPIFFGIYSS